MDLVLTDKQFEFIDDMTRHLMVMGSAGSGKTIFACTKVILYALKYPNARIGVFRQTLPSLRETAWREIVELLTQYNIEFKENKSNGIVTLSNGSTISFTPTDDEKKLRSLNLDMVYIEQCEELSEEAFIELDLRIRNEVAKKYGGQMLIVVQPSNKSHWLYRLFYQEKVNDDDYKKIYFSYLDNPFLPDEQKKVYESLMDTNYDRYLTHTLGEWISSSKQIFTNNWSVGFDRKFFNYYVGGIDWGWNSPACFLLCGVYDEEFYILGEVYKTEMTNSEFLEEISLLLGKYNLRFNDIDSVYCDSADPEKIEVFHRHGLNTYPSVKNVRAKIHTTQETKIHIDESCVNLIREMPQYEWKKNKDGELLEEPVKKNDHAVDALCYAVFGVRGELSKDKPTGSFDMNEVYVF
ncbi:PBSX family phage terminase large subunit [Methanobrevibacter sp.]